MPNSFFQFKQFTVHHDRCAMKVTTDACLFGAWVANEMEGEKERLENGLDIGCGTGLLSLMLAQKTNSCIDAVEIDKEAAEQARENVAASRWNDKIHIVTNDVLKWQPAKKYQCIISNPPFYENSLRSGKTEKNRAHHDEGLRLKELLLFIKQHLADGGSFFLLLPASRRIETENLLHELDLSFHKMVLVKQSVNHSPFRIMIRGGNDLLQDPIEETLTIKDATGEYTSAFAALLKDYYLYL